MSKLNFNYQKYQKSNKRNILYIPKHGEKTILKLLGQPKMLLSNWTLSNEIMFYKTISMNKKFADVQKFVPLFLGSPIKNKSLLLEYLPKHITLQDYLQKTGKCSKNILHSIAENLSTLHLESNLELQSNNLSYFKKFKISVPAFDHITPEYVAHNSDDLTTLIRILQNDRDYKKIPVLLKINNPSCIIHGDLKLDNILKPICPPFQRQTVFIDWELCGIGNPEYDLATLLTSFLLLWIYSKKIPQNFDVDFWLYRSNKKFVLIQKMIREIWFCYFEMLSIQKKLLLDKKLIMEYIGLLFVQYVYSNTLLGKKLGSTDFLSLLIAKPFISNPNSMLDFLNVN
ncbi:aminoglycoside phosphotransferase family protein [Nitrosarchaeum sp. AC2]|uniref:aminoglycoside phosphotransferase family protein n=1 Tax=Nitrosarchaeum sp. AC2 TaxID=2259673 RepID=UPI0015CC28E7|nr:aminoglycoside phosphotransferase family protein [Nitrosarchaeum sp. AC2]QLH11272.1 hypothetical protein DSQ20_07210 [Nitrosarchaeum sp. AC2]